MRSLKRVWSRGALLAGLTMGCAVGCGANHHDGQAENESTGSLSLALQSTAPSGTVYRLRNAIFEVRNVRTGAFEALLSSEEGDVFSPELTARLAVGDFTITLQEGWFLERVSGGTTGGAGAPGFGGAPGGAGAPGFGGAPSFGGAIAIPPGFPPKVPFDDSFFAAAGEGGSAAGGSVAGGPPIGAAGETGVGGSGGASNVVNAQLLSNAVQFFSIFSQQDSFVSYQFQVGGEVINFNEGRLHVGIQVIEADPPVCVPPEGALRPNRVLLENEVAALRNLSLLGVLGAIASNDGSSADPLSIYQRLIDSYASVGNARIPDAIHCGDELTDGQPSLNGFPITCDRRERFQFDNIKAWFPTAMVNRIDLAPQNGAHCGQQRMTFANNAQNRMFMIFEAQIPNPRPDLGVAGCAPLAQFWADANTIADPVQRGARLARAFLSGAPELAMFGFGPFLSAKNFTIGSGNILTNQFDDSPWTLRAFKLGLSGSDLIPMPFPVAESPPGALWNENNPLLQGESCRSNFLGAVDQLLTNDLEQMSFVINKECQDAESRNDFSEDYASQLSAGFRSQLEQRLIGTGLTPENIADRAQFAGSCMGCHQEANGRDLGLGVTAPFSTGFVQISEFQNADCPGSQGACFPISDAIRNAFLPSRLRSMTTLLGIPDVVDPCDTGNGGGGGSGGSSGSGSAGFNSGGSFPGGGAGGAPLAGAPGAGSGTAGGVAVGGQSNYWNGPFPSEPAPVVDVQLPSAATPVDVLQAQEKAIRLQYGDKTLGGKSAQTQH